MIELLKTQQDIPTLLASVVVFLALQLFASIGKIVWDVYKKKFEASAKSIDNLNNALRENTAAINKLELQIKEIEKSIAEIPKFKNDLRRLFIAVKIISGDKWNDIYRIIRDEEKEH